MTEPHRTCDPPSKTKLCGKSQDTKHYDVVIFYVVLCVLIFHDKTISKERTKDSEVIWLDTVCCMYLSYYDKNISEWTQDMWLWGAVWAYLSITRK